MKAVILAGGSGSRLRPITENVPKPMVSVLGRPIMEHIVSHLIRSGVTEIVATLHYRPRVIRDHFGDGADMGVTMRYTLETQPLGTAGSVKLATGYLDEPFLVVAGDALMDFDLRAFVAYHRRQGAKVSLCLKRVRDPGEFGIVITDEAGRVQRFLEKPGPSEVFSDTVNTGIYLIEPEVLAAIPAAEAYDFAGDLFPRLLEAGEPLYGYVAEGYWTDIGTLQQLRQAHWDLLDGKVRLPISGNRIDEHIWVGGESVISPEAVLSGPCWLGNNVRIQDGARIGPYAVIGDNCEVESHAVVHRSIVQRNSFIGEAADLRNCLVATRNIIEAHSELGDDAVVGGGCHLRRGARIRPGVLVWPGKEIDTNATVTENLVWESLTRPSMFGSRGVSGLANLHITPEFSAALGKAFGNWVGKGRRVAVSRDADPFSRLIKRALIAGLLSVGVDVDDLEEGSAPLTRFVVGHQSGHDGGMHVRIADEHPGVILMEMYTADGLPIPRGARRKMEAAFHRADFPKVSSDQVGTLRYPGRIYERYFDALSEHLERDAIGRATNRVIHHCLESNSAKVMADLLGASGLPHLFEGGRPGAAEEDLQRQFREIALLNHAVGVMVDRNGERLALVDEIGNFIDAERTQELLTAAYIRSARAGDRAYLAPDQPAFLTEMAQRSGCEVLVTRQEPAARLAEVLAAEGEARGWLEFRHFYLGFDAVVGALKLLEFLGRGTVSLHQFERQTPTSFRHQLTLDCPWDEMGRVMRELSQDVAAAANAVPEGVRLQYDSGRVFVLPSADAPQIAIAVEAFDAERLSELIESITTRVGRLIG
jgi:mannose-1-phosphate guanylyltransferase/phosphomannomutase